MLENMVEYLLDVLMKFFLQQQGDDDDDVMY